MRFNKIKKLIVLLGSAATLNIASISTAHAQGGGGAIIYYLQLIAQYTATTAAELNNLPTFILAWTSPDSSPVTTTIQGSFAGLGSLLTTNLTNVAAKQGTINNDLLNNDGNNVFNANNGLPLASGAANQNTLWYANDLVYSTLLESPFFPGQDPRSKTNNNGKPKNIDAKYNYIKNASGLNIFHEMPGGSFSGGLTARTRYQNYYNTAMAAESFGAYVLSNQYSDGNQFNKLQTTLIQQATDAKTFFTKVSSENIGWVLHQILLYQSQTFVLLTQVIQYQKQAVSAQVMTNAILLATNQMNESILLSNAKGQAPSMQS